MLEWSHMNAHIMHKHIHVTQVGFFIALGAYYVLSIPLGTYLAFQREMGLIGLWYGLAAGSITCCLCLFTYLTRVDWKLIAKQAKERVSFHTNRELGKLRVLHMCSSSILREFGILLLLAA